MTPKGGGGSDLRSRLGKKEEVATCVERFEGGWWWWWEGFDLGGNSFDGASQSLEASARPRLSPRADPGGGSKRKAEDNGGDEGEGEAPAEEMAEEERPHNYKTVLCKNFARGSCKRANSAGLPTGRASSECSRRRAEEEEEEERGTRRGRPSRRRRAQMATRREGASWIQ